MAKWDATHDRRKPVTPKPLGKNFEVTITLNIKCPVNEEGIFEEVVEGRTADDVLAEMVRVATDEFSGSPTYPRGLDNAMFDLLQEWYFFNLDAPDTDYEFTVDVNEVE